MARLLELLSTLPDTCACQHPDPPAATDAAREAADVLMMGKDLHSLAEATVVGREVYGNTMK